MTSSFLLSEVTTAIKSPATTLFYFEDIDVIIDVLNCTLNSSYNVNNGEIATVYHVPWILSNDRYSMIFNFSMNNCESEIGL